jgi:hypothetical protein
MKEFLRLKLISRLATVGLLSGAFAMTPLFSSVSYAHERGPATQKGGQGCSLATVKGTYVFGDDGFLIERSQKIPTASAGQEIYDGKGNVQGIFSGSEGGKITGQSSYTGKYTITPDCIMNVIFTDEAGDITHYDNFVSPDGSMFTYIQTDEGSVLSGWEKRVPN